MTDRTTEWIEDIISSGVATGGSGGSMNRGPRAPGGPRARPPKKLNKKIIDILLKN